MTAHFIYCVELLEDLHGGTGTGAGDIDALQIRDRHGRPVIRASHIRGVLRAAAEELRALGRVDGAEVIRLLGAAGGARGALRLTSLRMTSDAQAARPVVWGATARVEHSRMPLENTLRFVEHVPAGTKFQARISIDDAALVPLLERLICRVDCLGAHRTRGTGFICGSLKRVETSAASSPSEAPGRVLRLVLRNLEPICLPSTGYAGNLIQTVSFIRGQVLRGALLAWVLKNQGPDTYQSLLTGGVSVGDAIPLPSGTSPDAAVAATVMPIPLSILTEKPAGQTGAGPRAPWWGHGGAAPSAFDSLVPDCPHPEEKPKRPGKNEYLCRSGDEWIRYAPGIAVHLRNASVDLYPDAASANDAPELFSMEEIVEDTVFAADLRFDSQAVSDAFLQACAPVLGGGEWLQIGREGRPVEVLAHSWRSGEDHGVLSDVTPWTLTLTSDLIARGPELGFLQDLDVPSLIDLSGAQHSDFPQMAEWTMRGTAETESVHGFNAATGLRRSPALGIRRGSCWRVAGPGATALARVLMRLDALGERCEEGYGRFCINVQPIQRLKKASGEKPTIPVNTLETIHGAARGLARELARSGHAGPSAQQLQWLRGRALACTDVAEIHALLADVREVPNRRPRGGEPWSHFPVAGLERALGGFSQVEEKRLLVALVVQWSLVMSSQPMENA